MVGFYDGHFVIALLLIMPILNRVLALTALFSCVGASFAILD
jgi:hypothetical protein